MKLVVVSIDALGNKDIFDNKDLFPNVLSLIDEGSLINNVKTIFPSITYPIHATILTGQYPSIHGIEHNKPFVPFTKLDEWNWYYKNFKCETIVDVCTSHKKTVSAIFWPTMSGAKIQRNIPEIWDSKTGKVKPSLVLKYGTPIFAANCSLKFGKYIKGKDTDALDLFTYSASREILKFSPSDLTLIHFLSVDGNKHDYGIGSSHVKNAFKNIDNYVGELYNLIKNREDITLVLLSDHTQKDAHNIIDIEAIFRENNLLFNSDYLAYPWSCDGSCYVHIKDDRNREEIRSKLEKIVATTKGISKLYDLENENDISNNAAFILDAQDDYYYKSSAPHIGQHGYHPDRSDYDVFMICVGKNIKKGHVVESGSVINHAKTFAKILDIPFENGPGQVIQEIFK